MKILSILILLLISFQVFASNDEQAIREVMANQEAAWNRGDLKTYMNGYWKSSELAFVGSSGLRKGWQTTLAHYEKSYPDKATMGKLTFDLLRIETNGNEAFVLGTYRLQREKDNPFGYFTLYWKKIKGEWKIVIDHSS